MKILETPQEPKFKPVTVVFETPEELQYITKLVGMGSMTLFKKLTKPDTSGSEHSFNMFLALSEECEKQNIDIKCGNIKYTE